MFEFLEKMERTPKMLLFGFSISTILLLCILLYIVLSKRYSSSSNCPDCNCPTPPKCPDCNCAPCTVCKKCKKCKGDKSPCETQSMTDCAFNPSVNT